MEGGREGGREGGGPSKETNDLQALCFVVAAVGSFAFYSAEK